MHKILVIDDEPDVGMIFSRILADEGHKVISAKSGEAGLSQIEQSPPDIVFLDVRMPGIDGVETLRRIRKTHKDLPVIIMTAYQTISSAVETMKLGAFDYLLKPLETNKIKDVLNQAIEVQDQVKKTPQKTKEKPPSAPSPEIIATDPKMKEVMNLTDKVAGTDLTVLITGESGTGKEIIAHIIHSKSKRKDKPFIVVDCAALPESLIESELFGYEKGAFTGADTSKPGKFESANKGTLFLDEIGNLPLTVQSKLLRFLQEPFIEHLGGKKGPIPLDVRVIAATNTDLVKAIRENTFREDLYHRLKVFPISLPPLRNRENDISEFVDYFLKVFCAEFDKGEISISDDTMSFLKSYNWPGNIRELQNALHSAVLLADDEILPKHLPISIQSSRKNNVSINSEAKALKDVVKSVEKEHIINILKQTKWNRKKAAEILGIDYKTLYNKMKELNIRDDK